MNLIFLRSVFNNSMIQSKKETKLSNMGALNKGESQCKLKCFLVYFIVISWSWLRFLQIKEVRRDQ